MEIQACKNIKYLQRNVWKCGQIRNLVPRVSHLTALWGEGGETLVWSGHVLL